MAANRSRRVFLKKASLVVGGAVAGGVAGFGGGAVLGMDEQASHSRQNLGSILADSYAHPTHPHAAFYSAVSHQVFPANARYGSVSPADLIRGIDPIAKNLNVHPYRVLRVLVGPEKGLTHEEHVTLGRVEEEGARLVRRPGHSRDEEPFTQGEMYSRLVDAFKSYHKQPVVLERLKQLGEKHFSEKADIHEPVEEGEERVRGPSYSYRMRPTQDVVGYKHSAK